MSESRQYAYGSYVANGKHNPKSLPLATLSQPETNAMQRGEMEMKRNKRSEESLLGQNLLPYFH
jgi:hypothetical protein